MQDLIVQWEMESGKPEQSQEDEDERGEEQKPGPQAYRKIPSLH